MIPNIKPLICVAGLMPSAAFAQTEMTEIPLPDALKEELPAPVPIAEITTQQPAVLPSQNAQAPAAQSKNYSAEVAALRMQLESLKQLEAQDAALRQPASQKTLDEVESTSAAIVANEATQQLEHWKAQNLAFFAEHLAKAPSLTLPADLPVGIEADIALALVEAQTSLYVQPRADAEVVMRTEAQRMTFLRVAETGAFTLVWSPANGFMFVLSQFRQVF